MDTYCKKTTIMNVALTDKEKESIESVLKIARTLSFNAKCYDIEDFVDPRTGEVFTAHEILRVIGILDFLSTCNVFELE